MPAGDKIPASKLAKAAHSGNPTMRRRAALAKTLKGMHHKAGGGPLGDIGSRSPGEGGIREQLDDDAGVAKNYLDSEMYSGPGVNDRFFDSGTRIPGRQKAKNDAYDARLKKRN